MHTTGTFAPESVEAARERYETVGPVARTTVRAVARAMGFDREEYDARVTDEVIETAREAIFASFLSVRIGSREEFEEWAAEYDGEIFLSGSENVDRVAWHAGPAGEAVGATFQNEEEAAVETLRRQAFGRLYREIMTG